MENPKDETQKDDVAPPAPDPSEPADVHEDPDPVPTPPKKPKGPEGEEDSYEDGWYQVLKRRAGEAGHKEE